MGSSSVKSDNFSSALTGKLLVLDGGMGSMLQQKEGWSGCAELLNVEDSERVASIHRSYLKAGADVITTNTFSANAVSLAEHGLADHAEKLSYAGGMIARNCADEFSACENRRIYVAGSMGPTNKSLTLDLGTEKLTYSDLVSAYKEQARGLIRGQVDVLLIETIFDVMNAKAAVIGAREAMKELKCEVDIWLSVTLADNRGRMLTGFNLKNFLLALQHANPVLVTLNCGFGPSALVPFVQELRGIWDGPIGVYPNAGLPNEEGKYTLTPADFAAELKPLISSGIINIVGGCCGTTNEHISKLRVVVDSCGKFPSGVVERKNLTEIKLIGERCNVSGSRKFRTTIVEGNYNEAAALAVKQLTDGAWGIDINVDAPMLDAEVAINKVLDAVALEPQLIGVPIVIDSSNWDIVKVALTRVPGKVVVNSISLKDGEDSFLAKAKEAATYGASIVVMAADEGGQATTYEHRMQVCKRAYNLLKDNLDYDDDAIIFDLNVLAICTGLQEHMNYASDLLRAITDLHNSYPNVHFIGGLSNLSFAFRGCEPLRRSMHSVFLHYAQQVGMDMVILNPAAKEDVTNIPTELRGLLEDAILRGIDTSSLLMNQAERLKSPKEQRVTESVEHKLHTPEEYLHNCILNGGSGDWSIYIDELLQTYSPLEIITNHLMKVMEQVGERFGKGEMFLPQVIRAAEAMKLVVEYLHPLMRNNITQSEQSTAVLATVKGDVHDIGKNICAILLKCNGFKVVDLGVMVDPYTILQAAQEYNPAFVGLSGLITPSLSEMKIVVDAFQQAKLKTPILIGGATTSAEHTAKKLAPYYNAPVLWTSDATQLVLLAKKLYAEGDNNVGVYSDYVVELMQQQRVFTTQENGDKHRLDTLEHSRKSGVNLYTD